MTELFSNLAGQRLLASVREAFEKKPVYHRKHRPLLFVCGGSLGKGENSLREQFIAWAEHHLPQFICLLAEDALFTDSFGGEGRTFVNLGKFESVVAAVADCVLIFPESPGSWAETGYFAHSKVGKKTLIANRFAHQTVVSFLNNGPIDTISRVSFIKPVYFNVQEAADFTPIEERLSAVKWQERGERLPYQPFKKFNFKQKLLVVFEMLRLLRLAEPQNLLYALKVCFGGGPRVQELRYLLGILLAAKFIKIDEESPYFKVVAGLNLIEFDHYEIEKVSAQVTFFYYKYWPHLYHEMLGVAE
jgi:hypothetical protein